MLVHFRFGHMAVLVAIASCVLLCGCGGTVDGDATIRTRRSMPDVVVYDTPLYTDGERIEKALATQEDRFVSLALLCHRLTDSNRYAYLCQRESGAFCVVVVTQSPSGEIYCNKVVDFDIASLPAYNAEDVADVSWDVECAKSLWFDGRLGSWELALVGYEHAYLKPICDVGMSSDGSGSHYVLCVAYPDGTGPTVCIATVSGSEAYLAEVTSVGALNITDIA